MKRITLSVPSMYCDSCSKVIPNYLKTLDGVKSASGKWPDKKIDIEFDEKEIDEKILIAEITDLGYGGAKRI